MFANHTTAFATFSPVSTPAATLPKANPSPALIAGTLLETSQGWRPVQQLAQGDEIYTFDGGLKPITSFSKRILSRTGAPLWHVPAAALGNCDTLRLIDSQHVLIENPACDRLFDAPCVLAPISAMRGFRGIKPTASFGTIHAIDIAFETREIVYAQTGTLLDMAPMDGSDDGFYQRIDYGQTRALLALIDPMAAGADIAATRVA